MGDMRVPRMLHGKVLRSPVAHARIVSIDASAASAMPGVVARPHRRRPAATSTRTGATPSRTGPIVAIDRVRFAGEPVAAVAAEDEATAEAAASSASTSSTRSSPSSARSSRRSPPDAPLRPRRPVAAGPLPRPGRAAAGATATSATATASTGARSRLSSPTADIVVEGEYTFPAVYQYAMETHTVVAQVEGGEITLWATVPAPVPRARRDRGAVPACRSPSVRIVVPYLGGGFG